MAHDHHAILQSLLTQAQLQQIDINVDNLDDLVKESAALALPKALKHFSKHSSTRAKRITLNPAHISSEQLPLTMTNHNGDVALVAKVNDEQVLLLMHGQTQPTTLTKEAFCAQFSTTAYQLRTHSSRFDIRWFIPALARFKPLLWEVLLFSFFMQLLALLTPLFFQVVMDKVLVSGRLSTLEILIGAMVAVAAFEMLLKGLREYQLAHTTNRVDTELGDKLFNHIMHLPLLFFKSRSVGIIVMRIRELAGIREFITGAGLTLIIDLGFSVIFFAVMYYYSPLLTAIVALSIPCYILLCWLSTPLLTSRTEQAFGLGAVNNAFLTESVCAIETTKAMAIEPRLAHKYDEQINDYLQANVKLQFVQNSYSQAVELIQKTTIVIVLWVGATLVIDTQLTIGALIAFNMMTSHVSGPLVRLAQLWQQFIQAKVSVERLGDVLNTPSELNDKQLLPPPLKGHISLRHIDFRYQPNNPNVINNLSLDINAGQSIGIVGPSGSGKSTLTKVIQGLYKPHQGSVHIDGIDINTLNLPALRSQIGIVLQDNYLFNDTVRNNLAVNFPSAPLDKVISCAKLAGAHEFILGLSDGYDTTLSEGGLNLSGGQRQRLAIARALMANPPILIFDEATSALDDASQAIINENMKEISHNRTVIIIAHRLSTVAHCDTIVAIEQGQVSEMGNHQQLINQQGCYAKLWSMQSSMSVGE